MTKAKKSRTPIKKVLARHPSERPGRLTNIGGSAGDDWNNLVANQTINSLWFGNFDEDMRSRHTGAMLDALIGIKPRDELEAMIIAQLIACHNASLESFRRAMIESQSFEGRRENLNQANKCSRTAAQLLDALNKHRGKGQQKVTVEHVHVHSGGQAIVGEVGNRGGSNAKSEKQPHALAHSPGAEVRREDAQRQTVPISRDE